MDKKKSAVLWFTGLPGAGKTTLSNLVCEHLRRRGLAVEHFDGDDLRRIFPQTGFSRSDREAHIKRVGYMASRLEKYGVFVVVSLISPYAEARRFVRGLCGRFTEIYLSTPLEVCEKRDPKGLYAKARKKEIAHFTGVDDPYEPPKAPEVTINTASVSKSAARSRIVSYVENNILGGEAPGEEPSLLDVLKFKLAGLKQWMTAQD